MRYRELGRTGLRVSEIGFGGEWMDGTPEEARAVVDAAEAAGVNILDCWMPDPTRRSNLGDALLGRRERWVIQGHLGSTWQGEQYVRTRDIAQVRPAFEDLLARFHTDYMDLGMIHYVDRADDFDALMAGSPFMAYVRELRAAGTIRHVGLSTHNPEIARRAVLCPEIEMILFSVNPAFDMMPATDDLDAYFDERGEQAATDGMRPERAELYALAEETGTGITVMKGYMGGRLFDASQSPFGVALTPVQCLHYALTRPAVASVMVGFGEPAHVADAVAYESATDAEKDYASVLAGAPRHAYVGQCTYCGHCAPCPRGIDIAAVNKFFDLATSYDEVPDSVREHYRALGATAAECIACRACEGRCPFGVHVAERMAAAAELFGC
ncbi:aldo/keto reductase [Thermophilibacter provencensis]|uniref:Aldo/keto reductase n=1 Tax=Thermophilibacter provencensis TaxID=1852386 RepID=A0ABT7V0R0_9ACTN|nr:aldo/keto reductase [Thermophilibacter provencensis]MDM8270178.1 aldo/keto reductase [Thermophilibacter provencensis]